MVTILFLSSFRSFRTRDYKDKTLKVHIVFSPVYEIKATGRARGVSFGKIIGETTIIRHGALIDAKEPVSITNARDQTAHNT